MQLQRAEQSVRDTEAQILELIKDKANQGQILRLAQQKKAELEGRVPECNHTAMEEKI
jgi:hypothetical protein